MKTRVCLVYFVHDCTTTTTAFTAVENKIPSVTSLVKKSDYNTKISETEEIITDPDHDKYITTPEFNKFTAEIFYF